MKFFEKNMKFFVLGLVIVVGYYMYKEWEKKKALREQEAEMEKANSVIVAEPVEVTL